MFGLSNNKFEGKLLYFLGKLTNLELLDVSDNNLGGKIPDFLRNFKKMKYLSLQNCSFIGLILEDIGKLEHLQEIDLSFNKLSGNIPPFIFNIPKLQSFDLSNNELEGRIPEWSEGVALNLVNNQFSFEESQKIQPRGLNCLQKTSKCFVGKELFTSFAINCGGKEIMSSDGKTTFDTDNIINNNASYYVADNNRWAITFGRTYHPMINSTKNINNTLDPELYLSARTSRRTLKYYGLGLETGNYTVHLMFANIDEYEHVFDIYIQGKLIKKDFKIVRDMNGTTYEALNLSYTVNVTQSRKNIEISFIPKYEKILSLNPKHENRILISAINVTPNFKVATEKEGNTKTSSVIGILVGVSIFILLLCIVGYLLLARKWEYQKLNNDEGNIELTGLDVNTYRFSELNKATENFSPANKLGEGGFGVVYKGTLQNGNFVAVKKLLAESIQGNKQFIAEVAAISEVRQRNLVKLHGCCCTGNKRLLVYEYLEHGSLDTALYGRNGQLELDWDVRFKICLGIATGLNYLHKYSRNRIIHRDIKSSNILLDKHLNPKISDFGLAKLFEDQMTHISTGAAGTYGYLAPEYALSGHLTEKVDVFAFGVVSFEIISGKRCIDESCASFGPNLIYIIEWAWSIHESMSDDLAMVDPKLKSYNKEEASRIIHVAFLCTQMDPMSRPSMFHVIAMLNGDIDIGTLPSKPLYLMFWHVSNSIRETNSNDKDHFDSSQEEIPTCSYFQTMPLLHAHTGSKQKDGVNPRSF